MTYEVVSTGGHEIAGGIHFDVDAGAPAATDTSNAADPDASGASAETAQDSSSGAGVIVPVVGLFAELIVGAVVFLRCRTHAAPRS